MHGGYNSAASLLGIPDLGLISMTEMIYSARNMAAAVTVPVMIDVDDGFGKGLRGLLRQIVPDAALDGPVRISARELSGIGAGLRVRCAIGVTFKGDRRHGDDRTVGEPFFQIVIFRLAFGQAEPPSRRRRAIFLRARGGLFRGSAARCG